MTQVLKPCLISLAFVLSVLAAHGQLIINKGDPTALLENTLFIAEAATGDGDTPENNETTQVFEEDLPYGLGVPGTITITGWGFAANANSTQQDAVSVDVSFIYEGAIPGFSDGDEVLIGTVSNISYNHTGAGTYYVNFGASSVSAPIDGANDRFQIRVTVNNTDPIVVESIRFKKLTDAPSNDAKFSIAGTYQPGDGNRTWASFPIREDGYVDTKSLLGWIWVGDPKAPSDWVWSVSLNNYIYLPLENIDPETGGWGYSPRL